MNKTYFQPQLSINVGVNIDVDAPVYLIEEVINSLDMTKLEKDYIGAGRPNKLSYRQLLSIIFLAYMEGIYSSRSIEQRLRRDTYYMYLARSVVVSHTVINDFRSSLKDGAMEDLFVQFVLKLHELEEIQLKSAYIDGTKIEAYANRYSFVWRKAVNKHEVKLQINIKKLIKKINEDFEFNFYYSETDKINVEVMDNILNTLNNYVKKHKIEIKEGKGNRKHKIQKYIEIMEDFLIRQTNYDFSNSQFEDRNSYSKTDKDATFMRMKEDHMKNGQLKPGYNVQIATEGQYVIGVEIFNHLNDINTLKPFVDYLQEKLHVKFENLVADSGYASEKNYSYVEKNNSNYYIPYQSYYMEQTRSFKKDISKRQNMKYDEKKDVYICADNRELAFSGTSINEEDIEYKIIQKIYQSKDCSNCQHRKKCMPSAKTNTSNKRLTYSPKFDEYKEKALKYIKSDEGIKLRINRSIQAEGFFGVLKEDYNFRRFMLRGKVKVKLEMLLLCFAYNLRKLYSKKLKGKVGNFSEYAPKVA